MEALVQDLRYSVRTLVRRPGLTVAIIATLALGIGANTAIFTVLRSVVLRPLPFPHSERVVQIAETNERLGATVTASPPNVDDWARMSRSIEAMGLARSGTLVLSDVQGTRSIRGGVATPGWFTVQGIEPELGRLMTSDDLPAGSNDVALISHRFWMDHFAGDPAVLGTRMTLDGQSVRVIGVLPADAWIYQFGFVDVWRPLTAIGEDYANRSWRGFFVLGRMAEGVTVQQARDDMESIRASLAEEYPDTNSAWGIRVDLLRDQVSGPIRATLWIFLGAVGFVLLIGCVNVANLLLVRATDRTGEFALRAALGASAGRRARHLLTESAVVSVVGGGLGLLLAWWGTDAFLTVAPSSIPRLSEVHVDPRVLLFTIGLSALTALLFGLAPAIQAGRTDLAGSLRSTHTGSWRKSRLRNALVVGETALALVLLIGAGLMTKGFVGLTRWDPGFDKADIVTTWALAPRDKYPQGPQAAALFERGTEALRSLPGVVGVGTTSAGHLFGGVETGSFEIDGSPNPSADQRPSTRWFDIGPGYFAALGLPVVQGREFTSADDAGSLPVAVVNRSFVDRYLGDGQALGRRVTMHDRTMEIVGVVPDVPPLRSSDALRAEIYWPKAQEPRWATYYVIRTASPVTAASLGSLQSAAEERLKAVDPDVQISSFVPLTQYETSKFVSPRFNMLLVDVFALVALVLTAIGMYGVIAHAVAQRAREMAIRIAVGAQPGGMVRNIVLDGMRTALLGLGVGLVAALALSRVLRGLLFGVPATDPATYLAVATAYAAVAALACILPARRAARLDPVEVLRSE
ncbi:MAG: ABC transporter permease [Gemmatimonadetes bacterium]|nr:ABC transporter permease [Gemmatimonadota bacterium]